MKKQFSLGLIDERAIDKFKRLKKLKNTFREVPLNNGQFLFIILCRVEKAFEREYREEIEKIL